MQLMSTINKLNGHMNKCVSNHELG